MTSYETVYMARITKHGRNHKERDLNARIRDFDKYLDEHPSAEDVVIEGETFRSSIISDRQIEVKIIKKFLFRLGTPVGNGSLIEWHNEHWLVFEKAIYPNEAYLTTLAIRCNHFLKWVDKFGVQRGSWIYLTGAKGMDGIVKGNFRTWNGLITPQPNNFIEFVIPAHLIDLGQRFVVGDRAWFCVDRDVNSVDNLYYYYLTEDKLDRQEDSLPDQLADAHRLDSWTIGLANAADPVVELGQTLTLSPLVADSGKTQRSAALRFEVDDESVVEVVGSTDTSIELKGIGLGVSKCKINLVDNPELFLVVDVQVVDVPVSGLSLALSGDSYIRTTDYAIYTLFLGNEVIPITSFSISNAGLAAGRLENGALTIFANSTNKLGLFNVTVQSTVGSATLQIEIRPLW